MKQITILLLSAVLCSAALALPPAPAPDQTAPVALVGATVHIGNGDVIERGTVTFADGRITGLYAATDNANLSGHQRIDVVGQHVYPGFITVDSDLGLREVDAIRHTRDDRERGALNPSVRSLVAYNTDSEMTPTLRFNGVLTAQVSPKGGLLPGTSSIVQLDAWNWEDAVIRADDGVHLNWPGRQRGNFDFATFTFQLVDNERYPQQLDSIKQLLEQARAYQQRPLGPTNQKLAALSGLFEGRQTLYLSVSAPLAVVEAITYARELGIERIVLKAGAGALEVADFLKQQQVPVLVGGVHRLPDQRHHDLDAPYRLPAQLVESGLTVALSYPSLMSSRNLGFIAGTAAAYGLEREQALQLITLNTAKILGIDSELGSIEPGKRATLFVSAGDALDMRGQRLSYAFIDGRQLNLGAGMQQQLNERFKSRYDEQ